MVLPIYTDLNTVIYNFYQKVILKLLGQTDKDNSLNSFLVSPLEFFNYPTLSNEEINNEEIKKSPLPKNDTENLSSEQASDSFGDSSGLSSSEADLNKTEEKP
jgi:hypothetical protein